MFRNPSSTKVSGSVVRKVSSVGLLVAGAVGTSPWLRASGACTSGEIIACWTSCAEVWLYSSVCFISNGGQPVCQCS
jgi:hypothetical protein